MASAFARHFKQQDLSDVDLIIQFRRQSTDDEQRPLKRIRQSAAATAAAEEAAAAGTTMVQLACLPGHRVNLFTSEYFEVQVRAKLQHNQLREGTAYSTCAVRTSIA
jgi:hypothetical protein